MSTVIHDVTAGIDALTLVLDAFSIDLDAPSKDVDAFSIDLDAFSIDLDAFSIDLDAFSIDLDARGASTVMRPMKARIVLPDSVASTVLPDACSPIEWLVDPAAARVALAALGIVGLRGQVSRDDCNRWLLGTLAGRDVWTAAFNDEQFSLGRAFYTHLEEGQSANYFADAASSDARVEHFAPGLQAAMRELGALLTGGTVRARQGWCGSGVHVFPAHGHVADRGGVVHFDTEGLSEHHVDNGLRAFSIVLMLRPAVAGGGLRVWDICYEGDDEVDPGELTTESVLALYDVGDVVAFDSYRLHQIQPFAGDLDRVSVTIHLAEVDEGQWESWF